MSDRHLTFIPWKSIVDWENVARRMCLIASSFQGEANLSGVQRRSENELKGLVAAAINSLIDHFVYEENPNVCIIFFFISLSNTLFSRTSLLAPMRW